jgi:hypothetical protein
VVARVRTQAAHENAGRPSGASDATLSAARLISPAQKWAFAEKALQHAERAIEVLVEIMEHGESETARVQCRRKDPQSGIRQDSTAHRHHRSVAGTGTGRMGTRQLLNRAHFYRERRVPRVKIHAAS